MPEYDKEAYIEQQKARTKELTNKLQAGMQELFNSDKYKDYLTAMSQFHNYSSRNIMLIKLQKPDATRIAGADLWKKKFNRIVNKGEKALYIYAPMGDKKPETKLFEKLDPETGAPLLGNDGKVIMEEMTALSSKAPSFRLVPVFDANQTHGDPLPELVENLTGNVEHYEAFIDVLKAVSPLPIEFEPMNPAQDGYCRFGDKIGIREGMSETQTVAAIIHEVIHTRLHDKDNPPEHGTTENAGTKPKSKKVREIESESVAYVVAQRFGIETAPNSFGYLATYESQDMSEFKASLDTIRKEAGRLITEIEGRLSIICKERGIDLAAKEQNQTPVPQAPVQTTEPEYTTETHTETIAGVDFSFEEVKLNNTQKYSEIADEYSEPEDTDIDLSLPDPSIGFSEMNLYGYSGNDMLPLLQGRAVELFDSDHTIYLLYPDNTEAMAFDRDEILNHDGIYGVEREDWERSPVRAAQMSLADKKESELLSNTVNTFEIYQIRNDIENARDFRFTPMKELEALGLSVDPDNYELVYTAPITQRIEFLTDRYPVLNKIYQDFNINRPDDFTGHSVSVSDVIVLKYNSDTSSHFVDSTGFIEIDICHRNEIEPPTIPEAKSQPAMSTNTAKKAGKPSLLASLEANEQKSKQLFGQNDEPKNKRKEVAK